MQRTIFAILAILAAGPLSAACDEFDFWIGSWEIDQKILRADGTWAELPARTKVRSALDGCALVESWEGEVEFFWEGMKKPERMTGLSVRSFDPKAGIWRIYWMDSRNPRFGEFQGTFRDGVGEFFRESDAIVSRIRFSEVTEQSVRWELAISRDGRKTWRPVWVMNMQRNH